MIEEEMKCTEVSNCQRFLQNVTYFRGTEFEKTVQVGSCGGGCSKGKYFEVMQI